MKYYKGNIICTNDFNESKFNLNILKRDSYNNKEYYVLINSSKQAYLYFRKYSTEDLEAIYKDLEILVTDKFDDEIKKKYDEVFIDVFRMNANGVLGTSIIYEKIYDESGNEYGKELISGQIFPINSKYTDYDIHYEKETSKRIFFDEKNNMGYYLYKTSERENDYFYFIDLLNQKYPIGENVYNKLKSLYFSSERERVYFNHDFVVLEPNYPNNYIVKILPKMIFSQNKRIEYVIADEQLANELEVNSYYSRFETGFGKKRRKKDYVNKITGKALSNYLGDGINFVKSDMKLERISENIITKEMQELEYLLTKLKKVSLDDYNNICEEYHEILNPDGTNKLSLNTLSIASIVSLQNKAQLAFICHGGDSKRIIEYLEKQASIYLEKYRNNTNEKTKLSIYDLDKICNNFLNGKNSYSYKEQNEILKHLSMLYFFEIYENKDILTSNDLNNSYAIDNIKRMITIISVLQEENIIKTIPHELYDVNTIDDFLDVIKKIEFNNYDNFQKEDELVLVKKLQR